MRQLVIGASGQLDRLIVGEAVIRGHQIRCQSRHAARVPAGAVPPGDAGLLAKALQGHYAVIFAVGGDPSAPVTLFSDSTSALLQTMADAGAPRMMAITGTRGDETCSANSWLPSRFWSPLFSRDRHPD